MIKFDVFNRFSGAVQFTAEIDAGEHDDIGIKLGRAVKWASLYGASLYGANLKGASLKGANLYGASGVNDYVKCIQIETYPITYTSEVMQIGCERHKITEWRDFDSRRIAYMDGKSALKFWAKYKDWIFQTIELCPAKPTKEQQQ